MIDVHYRYPGSGWVLTGLDCSIQSGECVLLCGASGSGKSTVSYLPNGLIPHFFGGELRGDVLLNQMNTRNHNVTELFSQVGLVLQNTDAQLFNATVEDEIAFGLESLGLPAIEVESRIRSTAAALNIEHLLRCSPGDLSGGEKRLAAIASVLGLQPPLLILDEPYAHLDWQGMQLVRQALHEIRNAGTTVVVIEQNVEEILDDFSKCFMMDNGRIIMDAYPDEALMELQKQRLIPSYPSRKPSNPRPSEKPLLTIENLHCRMNSGWILRDICLQINRGETVAIIGRNGSGKTTLIKHFNGLLRPTKGRVLVEGEDIRKVPTARLAGRVGLVFQNPNDQFFKLRVRDEIHVGLRYGGKWSLRRQSKADRAAAKVQELIETFDLESIQDRSPYQLSEGEKKRVALASVMAMEPNILVLDEPTVGQDGRFREILVELLAKLERLGTTIVLVTHDLAFALATSDRWIVLDDGRVAADGVPGDILQSGELHERGAVGYIRSDLGSYLGRVQERQTAVRP